MSERNSHIHQACKALVFGKVKITPLFILLVALLWSLLQWIDSLQSLVSGDSEHLWLLMEALTFSIFYNSIHSSLQVCRNRQLKVGDNIKNFCCLCYDSKDEVIMIHTLMIPKWCVSWKNNTYETMKGKLGQKR